MLQCNFLITCRPVSARNITQRRMTFHGGNIVRQNRMINERAKTTARVKPKTKVDTKPKVTNKFLEKKRSIARTQRATSNNPTTRLRSEQMKENQIRRTRKDRKKI